MKGPIELSFREREPVLSALEALAPGAGQAEHESNDTKDLLRFFLPTPSFRRALDPNAMLIVGERGAGKTELFRVLGTGEGFAAMGARSRVGETSKLVAGYGRVLSQQTDQPSAAIAQSALEREGDAGYRAFWLGMLVARLLRAGEILDVPTSVFNALQAPSRPDQWLPEVLRAEPVLLGALDDLDARLRPFGKTITIAYDELDRVVPTYAGLFPAVRALLGLWLDWWRRWQRLRPKIMLRSDLLESRLLAFPDSSKLTAHRVELQWQRVWLYQMAIKRMLNGPSELAGLARRGASLFGHPLDEQHEALLGIVPSIDEDAFAAVMTALVGEFMGADPRKGYSYFWLPGHVADAQGRALPRPFLHLIAMAARSALDRGARSDAEIGPLLQPADFFNGLPIASETRIRELEEQRIWLAPLRDACSGGIVPMTREEILSRLQSIRWPSEPDPGAPPTTDTAQLLDEYLVPLGIFSVRQDGRINVPDIYRHGLKLRRKGGIARWPRPA